jgi:hypothetical protein
VNANVSEESNKTKRHGRESMMRKGLGYQRDGGRTVEIFSTIWSEYMMRPDGVKLTREGESSEYLH